MNPLSVIFSSRCLSCDQVAKRLFCPECTRQIQLIDPATRCEYCFIPADKCCCKKRAAYLKAAAFDPIGPEWMLYQEMRSSRLKRYLKSMTAYLYLQFEALEWKVDLITFPSRGRVYRLLKGMPFSEELARKFSHLSGIPIEDVFEVEKQKAYEKKIETKDLEGKSVLMVADLCPKPYMDALIKSNAEAVYCLTLFTDQVPE